RARRAHYVIRMGLGEKRASRFRTTVHFVVEIQRFVCDRVTPSIIEKLLSKGVAMHVYGVAAYA
ncbi:MAG: hypothetical protein MJE68_33935, partial [Proteobacteria bacterium]|nr:hypothetical protein [Pseudomonadota bacterium]